MEADLILSFMIPKSLLKSPFPNFSASFFIMVNSVYISHLASYYLTIFNHYGFFVFWMFKIFTADHVEISLYEDRDDCRRFKIKRFFQYVLCSLVR